MKATGNLNINTKIYWNTIYGNNHKRNLYATQGTSVEQSDGVVVKPTSRFEYAINHIESSDKVLDIGCGVGVFTRLVKDKHPSCEVWGVDISDKAIEDNKKENPDIKYYQGYIGMLKDIPENYFDVVFTGETLEHLDEPSELISDAYQALKKGGKLILTTPNKDNIMSQEHVWIFDQQDVEDLILSKFKEVSFEYLPDMEHLYVIFAVAIK